MATQVGGLCSLAALRLLFLSYCPAAVDLSLTLHACFPALRMRTCLATQSVQTFGRKVSVTPFFHPSHSVCFCQMLQGRGLIRNASAFMFAEVRSGCGLLQAGQWPHQAER